MAKVNLFKIKQLFLSFLLVRRPFSFRLHRHTSSLSFGEMVHSMWRLFRFLWLAKCATTACDVENWEEGELSGSKIKLLKVNCKRCWKQVFCSACCSLPPKPKLTGKGIFFRTIWLRQWLAELLKWQKEPSIFYVVWYYCLSHRLQVLSPWLTD